ncbi:hypothetical protein [Pectobacterium aquaticum]|uniref:Uncharacterized protein n=1 Tax=Pectobacterium aquaticum TaxID=2204145 RepID=A0AA93AN10_9GAMM|nr:hypothetical protein [Pectobacterium aquaticum]PLY37720.1 hypothetical protein F164LOC_07480 [Pectobacterium carotovorum]RRN96933.1 hypothetical protein DMB79_010535 [Pectobacterium aquaticum]RRO05524.1 hypothetical protein DMB83_000410 [Pectobacterium aquaticum]RRO10679.1 hypothetical protein DMB81_001415 [Pectobacterium aquaticum]RRO22014.1 hypothetical protein DMB84_007070 [Pectobacterium aquaticum]
MHGIINYNDSYSLSYREQLVNAANEASVLNFKRKPFTSEKKTIQDRTLHLVNDLICNELSAILDSIHPGYWGNSCQLLSSHIFAYLNHKGIAAEIVIGNVIINGTDEFETTSEYLKKEWYESDKLETPQSLHAWVTLGDDTIIDAALPPRLVKNYNAPNELANMIFISRASTLSSIYKIRHQPLVLGSEFFAKTNPPDPFDLLNALNKSIK